MSTDDALERLLVETAIRHTLAAYCQSCDDGRFADFGRCFTSDAVLAVMGREITGRPAIEGWIAAAMPPDKRGKHVTTNTVVVVDGDRATATSDYLFVAPGERRPRVTVAGRYDDVFVPDSERWLIARRAISFLGRGD